MMRIFSVVELCAGFDVIPQQSGDATWYVLYGCGAVGRCVERLVCHFRRKFRSLDINDYN